MIPDNTAPAVPTAIGPESTGMQPVARPCGAVHSIFGIGMESVLARPPAGTFATYREMRQDPTIAIARAAATIPIKAAPWSYELDEDAGGTDAMVDLVRRTIEPLRSTLLADAMYAIDYGFQAWEPVWNFRKGVVGLSKVKPLAPELTTLEVHRDTGDLCGVSQIRAEGAAGQASKVLLVGSKKMVWTYDREGQNWYGRSRMENIREHAYFPWKKMAARIDTYTAKGAGVIFVLEYPGEGEWYDKSGKKITSDEAAEKLLATIGQMGSVAVPRIIQPGLERMLQNTTNPSALMQWQMKFLEASPGHGDEMEKLQRYYDALKLRGWFVPERAATEGTHGTLAEAEAHADLGIAMAADTNDSFLECVNTGLVDNLLEFNFGPDARGLVRVHAASVSSAEIAFVREILTGILLDPSNVELALRILDVDYMLDETGLPKSGQVIDVAGMRTTPEPAGGPGGSNEEADPAAPRQAIAAARQKHGSEIRAAVSRLLHGRLRRVVRPN